jgi:hypothetical protein
VSFAESDDKDGILMRFEWRTKDEAIEFRVSGQVPPGQLVEFGMRRTSLLLFSNPDDALYVLRST